MVEGQKDSQAGEDKRGEDSLTQEGRTGKKRRKVGDTKMR